MKQTSVIAATLFITLLGCTNESKNTGTADSISETPQDGLAAIPFKAKCNSIEECERDVKSDDLALKLHAFQFLEQRKIMDASTNRTLHTKSAALEQQLIYWRHATKYCSDKDAERDRCVSIDSPEVPEGIREILKKEAMEAGGKLAE